jgi:hypothetical protein
MTDTAKAMAFAIHCLKWQRAEVMDCATGTVICDGLSARHFKPGSAIELETVLREFLGTRYFIQINRGTGSLFHWRVIIGAQDRSAKGASLDNAQAEGEDLWDTIFDACAQAAKRCV